LPHLNLTNLEDLDASHNFFDHPMLTSWFWNLTCLKYLNLVSTCMFDQFPDALGDLTSLQVLDLSGSGNYENMCIMSAVLKNLCNLEVLYISSSYLKGDVTELFTNLPRCSPNKLQELDLSRNQLTGMLPKWMGAINELGHSEPRFEQHHWTSPDICRAIYCSADP
jgi:Leucine-rich repeat (LRR) protein